MSQSRRKRRQKRAFAVPTLKAFGEGMPSRVLKAVCLPFFLTVFLIFGGASGEGFNVHALLLLSCGVACAIATLGLRYEEVPRGAKWLIVFLLGYIAIGLFHLIDLPIGIWQLLGGREIIDDSWQLLGLSPNSQTLSVAPLRTFNALVYVLVPFAAVLLMLRLGWRATVAFLPWTIVGLATFSAMLGLAQVLLPEDAGLYIYGFTNTGSPVGVFANVNHQASFLVMSLSFTFVLIGDLRSNERSRDIDMAKRIFIGMCAALQTIGILAAGSVAGYLLLVPMMALGLLIVQSQRREFKIVRLALPALILIPMIMLVAYSPQLSGLGVTSVENTGPTSRVGIAEISLSLLRDHIWFGGGLGTFEPLFKVYEDPETAGVLFVNHAHNDFLQWIIETGLLGGALMVVFLVWLLRQMFGVWRLSGDSTVRIRRAAASALTISLLHSFVDYPLRSPSLLFFASVCVVLLILPKRPSDRSKSGLSEGKSLTL